MIYSHLYFRHLYFRFLQFSAFILSAFLLSSCNRYTHYPMGPNQKPHLADAADNVPKNHNMHPENSPLETKEANFSSPSQLFLNRRAYGHPQMGTDKGSMPRHISTSPIPSQRYAYTLSQEAQVSFYQHQNAWRARVGYTIKGQGSYEKDLPVFAKEGMDIADYLDMLLQAPASVQSKRITLLNTKQTDAQCIYLGQPGMLGGAPKGFCIDPSKIRGDGQRVRMGEMRDMLRQSMGTSGASNFYNTVYDLFTLLAASEGPMHPETFQVLLQGLWNEMGNHPARYAVPFYIKELQNIPVSKRPEALAVILTRFLQPTGKIKDDLVLFSKESCQALFDALQYYAQGVPGNMPVVDKEVCETLISDALSDAASMGFYDVRHMCIGDKGVKFICFSEGFESKKYKVRGKGRYTIGYGHEIEGHDKSFDGGITKEYARALLKQDTGKAMGYIRNYVQVPMNQHQFDALTSYVYNVGPGGAFMNYFTKKKTRFIKYLNEGKYEDAAAQMDIVTQQKKPIEGLKSRQKAEQDLFLHGIYKD